MADIARKTKRYPADLTDEEWDRIKPLMPKPPKRGRPPSADLREMLNATRYMARSGGAAKRFRVRSTWKGCGGGGWRMPPKEFGAWQTVSCWFRRFVRRMLFQTIHDVSVMLDRERVGREATLHRLSIGCAAGALTSSARLRALWTARRSRLRMAGRADTTRRRRLSDASATSRWTPTGAR